MAEHGKIYTLLEKFSGNTLSEAEFNELCELLKDEKNASEVKRNLLRDLQAAPFTTLDKQRLDAMLNRILHREQAPVRNLSSWRKFAAAAAVIVAMAVGAYFAFFRNTEKPSIVTAPAPVQNDLLPGGNKATLTLADGSTLALDSAQNGALAWQGNAQIVKGEGALVYNEQQGNAAQNPVYNVVTTPKGGQYHLTLADGSKVWLNAASSVRFPAVFSGSKRSVEITGEAYFEVAHDASRPFHVSVNGVDVQVLGTHFNINAYDDEESIKTTLLEGSVKVKSSSPLGDPDSYREGVRQEVILKPGQQAVFPSPGGEGPDRYREWVRRVDLEQVMAWKNGTFNFDNADLQAIMRQIARWYDVDVEYQGEVPVKTFKGAISRNVPASKVLQMLEYVGVKFRIEGNLPNGRPGKIVVMP